MIIRNDAVSPTMMSEPVVRESARTSRNGGDISCGDEAVKSHDLAHSLSRSAMTTSCHRGSYLDIMGGGAPQGGRGPHYGKFLSQVSSQRNLECRDKRDVI